MPSKAALPICSLSHIGIVVEDIEKTFKLLSSIWDLQTMEPMIYSPKKDELSIGERFSAKVGVINLGTVCLELVQPLAGKSIWSEFLQTKGEGIQHIAFGISNYEEVVSRLQREGNEIVVGGVYNGVRWCFFNMKPSGILLEFREEY
jgi:methylmalonyl-CoA/ethylmalonyl-CoA epimerase